MKHLRSLLLFLTLALALSAVSVYYIFFAPFGKVTTAQYIYIDKDDTKDSIIHKLSIVAPRQTWGIEWLWEMTEAQTRSGKYEISAQQSSIEVFRMLRNGQQVPIKLVVRPAWTVERMASRLATQLMVDSAELVSFFNDTTTLSLMHCTRETLPAHFIPNTYEVYWTMTPEQFVTRIHKEHTRFWNDTRLSKAKALGLTPVEVATLASIVDEETNKNDEKPLVAGLYLNRLKRGMLLQADPTVKYAHGKFELRRILLAHLTIDSPYNTYKYAGLPPGPIRIPSTAGLESVLNPAQHSYIYMCAKEDFSGYHNFATTLSQHNANARRYQQELNRRKVK